MKRMLVAAVALSLTALEWLTAVPVYAGDPQAHTAAMLEAANAVAQDFPKGVGSPDFQIDLPEGLPISGISSDIDDNQCWTCGLKDRARGDACAQNASTCFLGAAVNEPDHWLCIDEPRQPERLSTLNSQASPLQTVATGWLAALGGVDVAAMACNYTHFASNLTPEGLSAGDVQQLTSDWAQEIPDTIERDGVTSRYACTKEWFKEYEGRVAKSLHFAQDAQSEHHASGNQWCSTVDVMVPLIPSGVLLDLAQGNLCRGRLVYEMAAVTAGSICDEEVTTGGTPTGQALAAAAACAGGSPLACTGLERLLRHHCDLEGNKSIACDGKRADRDTAVGAAYCEGERTSAGGQDFLANAASASEGPFRAAMQRWAEVCERPDPCDKDKCEKFCKRQNPDQSGFCLSATPDPECKPHDCVCSNRCGDPGDPCCAWDPPCNGSAQCDRATGLCQMGAPAAQCPGDSGSSGGSSGTGGASSTGDGGPGGAGGEAGDTGMSNAGADSAGGGTSGSGSGGPPQRNYPGDESGDPHLRTFDGLKYDLQAVGELTTVLDPGDGMEVQARTQPWGHSTRVAVVVALAARVGSDRVAFYLNESSTLNGAKTSFSPSGSHLPGGGIVYDVGLGEHIVRWPDGTQLAATPFGSFFRVELYLPTARAGKVTGLLGGFDGDLSEELHTRDGAVLPSPVDFETFYGVYAESWRIAQADSLFDYGPGENTETFTDRAFPRQLLRVEDLDASVASNATLVCDAAGIIDPYWLDACILDVGETGDDSFADSYVALPTPKAALEIKPPRTTGANNAGGLGSPSARSGTLGFGDQDFFSFAVNAGESIQIRAVDVASGPFVPYLKVYDASGALVSSNYSAEVAYASFTAATSGTFTVVVSDASGRSDVTAGYALYFVKAPGSNEGGALTPGGVVSDTIDKGDLDSYTFSANAGEAIQLRMVDVAGGAFVPALAVYGPSGVLLTTNYSTDVAYASFNASATGTYTVVVYDWSSGAAATGDYQLHFVKAPGASEHGALTSGSSVTETIDKGDLDSYTFSANAGEAIQLRMVDVAGGAFVPALAVYSPTGALISNNYSTDVAYASFSASATGTYTVVVYDWSSGAAATGDYQLHFVKAPGPSEYGELTSGRVSSGTIDKGDLDSYTFTATTGESVQLRFVDLGSGAFVPALAVYSPTGALISNNYSTDVAYASFSASATGTYTVVVYDWSSGAAATGDYQLYFAKAPGASEYGELTSGGVSSGTIDKGDLDSYTFTAMAGESVQLRFVDLGSGPFVPALTVYGPSGAPLSTNYSTDVAYASFSASSSGTYTVIVYDWSSGAASAGDYDLYFAKAPGANEGGALTAGAPVAGTIDKGDLDSFTFAVSAGAAVQLTLTDLDGSAFTPALAAYSPTGAVIGSTYSADSATLRFTAAVTGTYTVIAYDWSSGAAQIGTYSLDLE